MTKLGSARPMTVRIGSKIDRICPRTGAGRENWRTSMLAQMEAMVSPMASYVERH